MALGYMTAARQLVSLIPIPMDSFAHNGAPTLKLSGREYAAMTTGRVMRAAQVHFDYPVPSGDGGARAGRAAVAPDELSNVIRRKQFAVFEDGDSNLVRLLYRELVVRFRPDAKRSHQAEVLKKLGLSIRRRNRFNPHQVIVFDGARKYHSAELVEVSLRLADANEAEFATPNFVSQYLRTATTDAFRPSAAQWHLKLVGARQAWALTRGKRSVTVAVLDDGVDVEHPELKANVRRNPDPSEPRDLCGRDFFLTDEEPDHFNPRPKRFRAPFHEMAGNDIHGTPCAGVAVGRGTKSYGLAPRCRLLPVKIFHGDDLASDSQVADAIRYAALFADVLSCSWSGSRSPDLEFALRDAASIGRGSKGSIVVCATGNDNKPRVGYPASDPNCIAVGASTDTDELAWYSNRGPQVWVVAPSNGGTQGIFTTDVSISGRGFNTGIAADGGVDGLYTNDFGGTSSATPLVAGLAALMLSIDPSLSPGSLRKVLADSVKKIGPASAYDAQGHSDSFGFGRIDAQKAVSMVRSGVA